MKKNVLRLTIILLLVALCVMQFSACSDEVSTPNQPGNDQTGGATGGATGGETGGETGGDNDTETPISALTFELNKDGQSYTLTGLSDKTVTKLTIPSTYQGLPVTSIGEGAFFGCTGLTSITISNNVTSIGARAFYSCTGLTSITIPNSVTSIAYGAFDDCYKLVEVYNLSNLSIEPGSEGYGGLGYYAKVIHTSLDEESILHTANDGYVFCVVGDNVWLIDYIGTDTVLNLPGTFNGREYEVNQGAFYGCFGLTSITIPNTVMSIGAYAFFCCTGLTSITIPNSVTSIEEWAFGGCYKLVEVYNLSNLSIEPGSEGYGGLGYYAKVIHTSLDEESIRHTTNDGYVFCVVGDNVWLIGYTGTDTVLNLPGTFNSREYEVNQGAFSGCTNLTSIIIPSSVTSIGAHAFFCCTGLTSITIGNSVASIGDQAFSRCTGLTSITVDKDNTKYHSNGNCLIETESKTLLLGCMNSVIPSDGSVTSIGYGAFEECANLISITIPDSVASIGSEAFSGCVGLTSITIPDSVTSIELRVFSDCTGLTSITIPNSVTSIDDAAFAECTGLTSVIIGNGVTSMGWDAFLGCTGLTSITVDKDNTKYHSNGNCLIETGRKTLILGCKNSVIPSDGSVTSIGTSAFYGCTGLTSITIPDGVTRIGEGAFYRCIGLTSITIPGSVTGIGYSAFSGCTSLTSIQYNGTKEQWIAINESCEWLGLVVVHCSDGDIN